MLMRSIKQGRRPQIEQKKPHTDGQTDRQTDTKNTDFKCLTNVAKIKSNKMRTKMRT